VNEHAHTPAGGRTRATVGTSPAGPTSPAATAVPAPRASGQTAAGDVRVLLVGPGRDEVAVVDLRDAVWPQQCQGRQVIVDLSSVEAVEAGALGVLVCEMRRAREVGGDVRVVVTHPQVRHLLRVSSLDTVFAVYESVDDARS